MQIQTSCLHPHVVLFLFNSLPHKYRNAHQLKIKTGRYARNHVDRTQRFCTICECYDIEDEYHFILICPVYRNIGKKYINVKYIVRPSMFKLCQLLQEKEKHVLYNYNLYCRSNFNT